MLWHLTAEYTPQGDIGKYPDEWIEGSLEWTGRKGFLIDCLVKSGWLDYEGLTISDPLPTHSKWQGNRKLFVHDWHDHADSAVVKRLQRLRLPFLSVSTKVTGQSTVTDETLAALARARAKPEPSQSLPEPPPPPPNGAFPPVAYSEWPETAAAVAAVDPATNGIFTARLVQTVLQAALSDGKVNMSDVDDAAIARAIRESVATYTGRGRHGAGLLLRRVPEIIITWGHEENESRK